MALIERIGAKSGLGQASEATYGVPVAPTAGTPFLSCTIDPDPGLFSPPAIMLVREKQVFPMHGQYKLAGAINGPLFPTNGIPYLVNAIGADVVSGTVAPYTHTISATDYLGSLTVEKNLGNYQSEQYAGVRVNKLQIKSDATDTPVEFTADVIAQSQAVLDVPNALSFVDESPFVFAEATIEWNGVQIGSVTKTLDLNLENALAQSWTHGNSHDLQFLTPTARLVNGTLTVVFYSLDDATYGFYTQMFDGLQAALSCTFTHPASGGSVQMTSPAVEFSKIADDIKLNDIVIQTVSFEGFYDLATASPSISAVVTNSQATAF